MISSAEPENQRLAIILDEAARLFHERGYGAVGMRTIADVVGVRASTLYHYFESKAHLLYQISLGVARDFAEDLLPILDGPGTPAERLALFIRSHIEWRWRRRHWISTAHHELRSLEAEWANEISGYLRDYQHTVQAFIARGVAEGAFQVHNSQLAGIALLDMINGVNGWYRPDGPLTIEQIAAAYADLAVGHLLRMRA
ncbi:MAG: TetR/AcrR family transcriptional regulator [Oscillochloris sp.]|nr:TetR/AcrR family transcriptional regulator [Oscillochloris sp.]